MVLLDAIISPMYHFVVRQKDGAQRIMKFQDLDRFTISDVDAAIRRDDPGELQLVSVTVALSSNDRPFAEDVCLRLVSHANNKVRGNAVMSLGHIARRFRMLTEHAVKPVIEAALAASDEYVRTHAKAAADEIHQFLHWTIRGHSFG